MVNGSIFDVTVLVLSVSCMVMGFFLLAQKGVRMMRGGILFTISVGLAVIGILLALGSVGDIAKGDETALVPEYWEDIFQLIVLATLFYIGYSAWHTARKFEEELGVES